MLVYHVPHLTSVAADSLPVAASSAPSWVGYLMTGLVTFCIALIFDNRKRSAREREKAQERFDKQDDSLSLINQALAVLVSQISPVIVKLAEVDARLSALDVSAGVLRAALDNHLAASAVWEKRLIDQFASMSRDQDRMQRYQEGNGHG